MKNGDRIIWDSGFGFELGVYVGESKHISFHSKVNISTGIAQGACVYPTGEIFPFSENLILSLLKKY